MRRLTRRITAQAALCAALAALALPASPQQGLAGGGPIDTRPTEPCITAADWARAAERVAAYERAFGPLSWPSGYAGLEPYAFYPQAGTIDEDLFISNYVDLDATAGVLDFDCSAYTYDGHDASDNLIRSFGEQLLGVPVFAAQDGVVTATDDGNPDMNIVWAGQPANFVVIDHGAGRVGYYWHLRNGSVAVAPGEAVVAGQQIGEVASSGNSNYPHLHFATYDSALPVEPFTGPCNPGTSGWVEQPPFDKTPFVYDFGFSSEDLAGYALPSALPRTGQLATTDPFVYHWIMLPNLPALSTWRVVYRRPDGTVAFDSGTLDFGNPFDYAFSWWYWTYDIADMETITGTWSLELEINGELLVDAPLEVAAVADPGFNRPPEDVAVVVDPPVPTPLDVLRARVVGETVVDDLDYDIVSHRWTWTVDGAVVRDVTTAARGDVLPALPNGGLVQLDVTPTDGVDDGGTASLVLPIPGFAFSDLGNSLDGTYGAPLAVASGSLLAGDPVAVSVLRALEGAAAWIVIGAAELNAPFKGGVLVPDVAPPGFFLPLVTDQTGTAILAATFPPGLPSGFELFFQWWVEDPAGPVGFAASQALKGTVP